MHWHGQERTTDQAAIRRPTAAAFRMWFVGLVALCVCGAASVTGYAQSEEADRGEPVLADGREPGSLRHFQRSDSDSKSKGAQRRARGAGVIPRKSKKASSAGRSSRSPSRSSSSRGKTAGRSGSERVETRLNIEAEDLLKPAEERTYAFSIVEGTYAELVENFARMAGLGVLGEAPTGTVTFVSVQEMDFKAALNRVRLLLFKYKPIEPYWLVHESEHLEVIRVTDFTRFIEHIYPNLPEFQKAQVDDNELAMLLYTPATSSVADFEMLRDFMPDYVRIAPYGQRNSLSIFALAKDIRKYLSLIQLFEGAGVDPRVLEKLAVEHLSPSQAVETLRKLMEDLEEGSGTKAGKSRRRGEESLALPGQRTILFPDDAQGVIVVRAVPKRIDEIKEMLAFIDVKLAEEFHPILIPLEYADVDEMLSVIRPLLGASTNAASTSRSKRRKGSKTGTAVTVEKLVLVPYPRTNTLVALGTNEETERVRRLVELFDLPVEDPGPLILQIENVTADWVVSIVTQAFRGSAKKGKDKGAFSAFADANSNTVILVGDQEKTEEAQRFIERLDVAEGEAATLHKYKLQNALPTVVLDVMLAIEAKAGPAKSSRKKGGKKSRGGALANMYGDDDTMTLYVVCTQEEWTEKLLPMIQSIDEETAPAGHHVIIDLEHIDAQEAVTTLNTLLSGAGRPRGKGAAAAPKIAPSGEALVITGATDAEIDLIRAIVADIDRDKARYVRRLFTVEYINPAAVKAVIESTMTSAKGGPRGKKGATGGTTVGMVGNTLVVSAEPEDMEAIADLIRQLDVEQVSEQDIRVYRMPPGVDVQKIGSSLQMLHGISGKARGKTQGAVELLADQPRFVALSATQRLLVAAPLDRFEEIEETIKMMTEGAEAEGIVIKFLPVEHGDAAAIAALMQPILTLSMTRESDPKHRSGGQRDKISVTPDVNGERIIIAVPKALVAEAESLIQELDRPTTPGQRVLRMIRLSRTKPEQMVEAVNAILSGAQGIPGRSDGKRRRRRPKDREGASGQPGYDVTIVAAPGSGAVVLTGDADDVDDVERWIKQIDSTAESERILKIYRIEHADLGTLADTIMAMCDRGSGKRKVKPPRADDLGDFGFFDTNAPRVGTDLVLTTDYWNKTLVVSATPSKIFEVDQIVALWEPEGDEDPPLAGGTSMPYLTYKLKNIDAFDAVLRLEDILNVLWPYVGEKPDVDYISDINTLVVRCLPEHFAEIEDLIVTYVDKEATGATEARIYKPIKGSLPGEIAAMLKARLAGFNVEVKRVGVDLPTVIRVGPYAPSKEAQPCVLPQSLLDAVHSIATAVVTQAEDEGESEDRNEKRRLAQQMIQSFAADATKSESETQDAAEGASPLQEGTVRILYDNRSGVIRIEGPSRLVKEAEEVLDEILKDIEEMGPGRVDIRVYRIKYRDVQAVASILETMFGVAKARQQPQRGGNAQQQQQLRNLQQQLKRMQQQAQAGQPPGQPGGDTRPGQQGKEQAEGSKKTGTGQIVVVPDPQNNTLIVKAATEDFPVIEELLATIDRPAEVRNDFRVFKLKNLAAADVEQHLKTLLGISGQRRATVPRAGGARGKQTQAIQQIEQALLQMDLAGPGQTAINAATQVKITSNPTANTIFVMAPQQALEMIEDLIAQIDQDVDEGTSIISVVLENAEATQIAKTMEAIYGEKKTSGKGGGPKPIKFVGDAESNTIFITAPEDLHQEIVDRIKGIDKLTGELKKPSIRVIKLAAGTPSEIAKILTEAFTGRGGKRGSIRISSDDATKQLFVIAPDDVFEEIESLTSLLDQPSTSAQVKVFTLEHARATEVHDQLMNMVKQLRGQIKKSDMDVFSAVADERSNAIVVMGGPRTFALVGQVIEQIDVPPRDPTQIVTAIYRLVNADAVEVARNINNTYKKRDKGVDPPRAEANASSNILIVRGTKAQQEAINNEIIIPLEEGSVAPETEMKNERMVLEHAKPDDVADTLTQIFTARFQAYKKAGLKNIKATELSVAVTPDMATRSIMVTASEANMNLIKELVTNLDQPGLGETGRATKVFSVQFADPDAVAKIVREAFKTRGKPAPQDVVTVAAEWYTQSIVATANEENLTKIEALIRELDQDTGQGKVRKIHMLEHAEAADVARIINQSMRESGRATRRDNRLPVSVVPNEALNVLVITGPANEVDDVIALANELDREPTVQTERITRVYHIKYADPGSLLGTMNHMFRRQRGSRPEDQVDVGYDWGTSKLVVSATPKNLEKVEALLKDIDIESTTVRSERVIKLKYAHAEDLARNMQRLFQQIIRGQRGQQSMTIAADAATNSLIVFANEAEFERVHSLIEALDVKPEESRERIIKSFKLSYSNPSSVRNAITNLFRPSRARRNPQDEVAAIEDWSSMSVIVSASADNMERVEEMIENLDQPGSSDTQVHVVELEHADGPAVFRALQDVFIRGQGRRGPGQASMQVSNPPGTNTILVKANEQEFKQVLDVIKELDQADGGDEEIEVISLQHTEADLMLEVLETYLRKPGGGRRRGAELRGDIRITANPQNNTIVISGGAEEIEQLKGVIATLDVEVEGAGNAPKIIQLQYARASQIESMLTKMFQDVARGGRGRRGRGGGSSMVPVIAADDASNTLIVRAGATDLNMIENLIEQLDTPESGDQTSFTIIALAEGVNVVDLAELVETTVNEGERIRAGQVRGSKPDQVVISPDPRANVLVVAGSASLFADVERLAKQLERMGVAGGTSTRILKIKGNPEEIKRVLEQIIEENTRSSGRGSKSRRGSRRRR